jgi:hypothetical protein
MAKNTKIDEALRALLARPLVALDLAKNIGKSILP